MTKIAVVVGSNREGSYNRALGNLAVRALQAHGADVADVDLAALGLPLYLPTLEAGAFPPAARRLKELLAAQHGLLFISPEYNGSITPLLKNAIDWASRPGEGESPIALTAFRGKASAVMSASVSPFGGLRGLMHLRQILSTVQTLVIPEQVLVPNAQSAFDTDGDFIDPLPASLLDMTVARLVKVAQAISG